MKAVDNGHVHHPKQKETIVHGEKTSRDFDAVYALQRRLNSRPFFPCCRHRNEIKRNEKWLIRHLRREKKKKERKEKAMKMKMTMRG